jgi:hypothetical protein
MVNTIINYNLKPLHRSSEHARGPGEPVLPLAAPSDFRVQVIRRFA